MKSNKTIISCKNLRVGYGKKANQPTIVEEFNYNFKKGKVYAIIGNSGVGKTTLISHFNGLLKSSQGDIKVGDYVILGAKKRIRKYKKIRKQIGFVFQNPEHQLFKDTVIKDVAFGPICMGVNKNQSYKLAQTYLKRLNIHAYDYESSPFELSNGQQKRVSIAGVLALEPTVFIFDEPTAGLDQAGIRLMKRLITNIRKQNKTVIFVSHNMDFVLEMADEVLLLHNKKIIAHGDPYRVFNSKLLSNTHMHKPIIMQALDHIYKLNPKFKKILTAQPRTEDQFINVLKRFVGHSRRK